jgi:hypothetical protein
MISYKIPAMSFLAFVMMLGGLVGIQATKIQAQPFDITSEQGNQEALITVKLATNNTVVIPPNGTIIEVPGNVTVINNDTIVVAPENVTVTPLPGNVTVITPPEPEPCGCPSPAENVTSPIGPVIVRPAPGQEVITENGTELIANESQEEPIPIPENETTIVVQPADNQTTENEFTFDDNGSDNNNTALAPAALSQLLPWWQA